MWMSNLVSLMKPVIQIGNMMVVYLDSGVESSMAEVSIGYILSGINRVSVMAKVGVIRFMT